MTRQYKKLTVHDFLPSTVLSLGYSFYLQAASDINSAIKEKAIQSVERFDRFCSFFEPDSKESVYLWKMLMASIDLGRGISSRKKNLLAEFEVIETKKEEMTARISEHERWRGVLTAAAKLFLIGGFGYFLVGVIVPKVDVSSTASNSDRISLTAALGFALVGAFFRSIITAYRIGRLVIDYTKDRQRANLHYRRDIASQYDLALVSVNAAWKSMTGEEPPETDKMQEVLFSIVLSDRGEDSLKEDANAMEEELNRPGFKESLTMLWHCLFRPKRKKKKLGLVATDLTSSDAPLQSRPVEANVQTKAEISVPEPKP
jgi:hypothetical protein